MVKYTSYVYMNQSFEKIKLSELELLKLSNYKLDDYIFDVEKNGLENTWKKICKFEIEQNNKTPEFLKVKNFGELYEIGLAIKDKNSKKKSGQYFTPDDVASVMSEWFLRCEGNAVCDVACGTGKLILTYLELLGYEKSRILIESGLLYIYDFDETALLICKTAIAIKYGIDLFQKIHAIYGDFLDKDIVLPNDCKVISTPPYAKIEGVGPKWEHTTVIKDTAEFYSAFMEKIFNQSKSAVIITPFSFISGNKFYSLRRMMCLNGYGFIVAFDNVPGNIFCGRKHGIFNSNTANSVRAAITVFNRSCECHGFKVTPLIRFKNEQRSDVLKCDVLENLLNRETQNIDNNNKMFKKLYNHLNGIFNDWMTKSSFLLSDLISKQEEKTFIDIPNTCRYYTTGSSRKLSRGGSITIHIGDPNIFDFVYCFINSSFTYWWWRVFDGGITYPRGLLMQMPVPYNLLTKEDKKYFSEICSDMKANESKYIITKVNAGGIQENVKFPKEYRNKINKRILQILGRKESIVVFDDIHRNEFVKENN